MRIMLLLATALSGVIALFALSTNHTVPSSLAATNEIDYCGSNFVWQELLAKDPTLLPQQEALEEAYYQSQQTANLKTVAPPYTIPVVFHIVHEGGSENISVADVQLSLDHLNQSFANSGPYNPSTGVATNIDFCLAKRTPEGLASSGIERINDPLTNLDMGDDLSLKNLSRYDPTQYLNIWVVREICNGGSCGVAGYAYLPSAHGGNLDGIVVESRWLGNSPANSSVLTHEVGHYLGLYHTFEGGCQNDDCLANGDRVCDTPPDQSTAAVPCNASPNSCTTDTNSGFATDQPDMFQNYMDYGDWNCYSMFTAGQRDRMHFFLEGIRVSLQSSQGCVDPCMSPLSVSITNDFSEPVAIGEIINLTANGDNVSTYTWYLDGVEIGTGNPLAYAFPSVGSYNLSVQANNSDPNCQDTDETLIRVQCPVQASFTPSSFNVTPGTVVFFTNESTNANSYEWFVDGSSEATSNGFFYQFDNLGTYTVSLDASNNNCTDDFAVVITVGSQGSSQTGLPIWPIQGGSNGGFHTLDWRTTPPLTGSVAPISDLGGGATGAAFNSCGGVLFYVAHTGQNTANQLFIYRPDGTPLLNNSTPNAPGLHAVKGPTELQVVPVPLTQDEWYLIYREYSSDAGAPASNAAYLPLRLMYSRVRLEADGQLTVVVRDQVLNAGATSYTYSDGMAVSRTVNGDANQHYLYAGRRGPNQDFLSLDRWVISNAGITWQDNTGNMTAQYWNLTHAGSYVELSPTEDRVVIGNRNQFSNFVDFIIVETASFSSANAISLMGEDLILVPDGQPQDVTNVLPVSERIGDLASNNSYPLMFLRNFQRKLSGVEFSPNGRFLYLANGGYGAGGTTNITYLAQVDLESSPLEVRLQMQSPPSNYSPSTGLSCSFSACLDQWESITGLESSYDGNLYFSKRQGNQLFVIPNPNNFMPQRLIPGNVDLSNLQESNIPLAGGPSVIPDQIDGFNYLSTQSQTVNLSIFGLDCAGDCRPPFEVQITSNDDSFQETFTITDCPTIIPICADTNLIYRITDLELGIEFPNAIVNGEANAPLGSDRFEFSEPQGCPGDCDEPYVYFYGEDADYNGRTLLSHNGFLFIGGQRGDEALLTKTTPAGEIVWTQTMHPLPTLPNVIVDLKIDSEGLLIGAGSGRDGNAVASFSFKLDPDNGATIWTRTYDDPTNSTFNVSDIFESPTSNDYVLLGSSFSTTSGLGCDAAFYSIDRNDGDITSERIHYHLGSCEDFQSVVINGNNFYATGRFNFSGGGFDRMRPAVVGLNSTGTPIWSRLYLVNVNQTARMYSSDISMDGPNNLITLAHGDDNGTQPNNNDLWIFRTNLAGGAQWAIKYTLPEAVDGKEILVVDDGYVILARARLSNSLYLLRVNGAGTQIWAKRLDNLTSIGPGDELVQIGDFLYLTAQHTANADTQLALLRINFETGEFPDACITNEDVDISQQFITAPYDGFNSISPYDGQLDGSINFDLSPSLLEPLAISCAPPCGPEDCDNGIDDDGDGLADCEDPDCDCEEDPCPDQNFVTVFGLADAKEAGYSLLALPNNNILIGTGAADHISLMEVSPEGVLVTEKRFSTPNEGIITDLFLDSDGYVIGSGRSGIFNETVQGLAFRYDYLNQDMLWFNITLPFRVSYSIIEPVAGGDIVYIGNRLNAPGTGDDVSWLSLDRDTGIPTTNISANLSLGGPESFYQTIVHNNKFYHTGRMGTNNSAQSFRASVSRYDLNGVEEWTRLLHVPTNNNARLYGHDIDVHNDELYVLASGDDDGTSSTQTQVFLYKLSTSGELLWTQKYDLAGFNNEWGHEIVVLPDGLLIYGAERGAGTDLFLLKVDFSGDVVWSKRFLGAEAETLNVYATEQIIRVESSIYFTGTTQSFNTEASKDVILVRTNLLGELDGDCYPSESLAITQTLISNATATPVTLNSSSNDLNFEQITPLTVEGVIPQVANCLTACEEICDNGIDDDGDGLADCEDPECDCEEDCDSATFVSTFGSLQEDDTGSNVILLSSGNLLTVGNTANMLHFIETTEFGELVRQQQIRFGDVMLEITDVHQDSDGMIIGAGRQGPSGSSASGFAFRYDYTNNQMLWWQQIQNNLFGQSIIEPVVGGDFIFTSNHHISTPSPGFGEDPSWQSLDRNTGQPTGNISANFDLGVSETFFKTIFYNNKFYHTGRYSTSTSAGSFRTGISKFSVSGQEEWTNLYHVPINGSARLYGQDLDIDDNHLINLSAGDGNGSSNTNTTFFISKVTLEGDLVWTREYDVSGMNNEYAEELVVVDDGFVILGQNRSGDRQVFLLKTDKAGNVLWSRVSANGSENSLGRFGKTQLISLGSGFVFTGSTNAFSSDNTSDILLVRTNSNGEVLSDCWPTEELTVNSTLLPEAVAESVDLFEYPATVQLANDVQEILELPLEPSNTCFTACDEICDNGIDDDDDGLIDCEDPDLADDCCCYTPPVLELGDDIVVCENGVIVLDAGPDFTTYQWSDLTTEQTITTTFPGEYSVTVTDQCGNTQSDTINIIVDPASAIDLGPDVTLCSGETLTLSVDGFATYEWFPETGFDCNDCPTVVFTPTGDTEIIVVATSAAGCISTDTLLVMLEDTQAGEYNTTGLCPGESLMFGDQTITEAGLYLDTVSTGLCLTIDSLEVSLLETFSTEEDLSVCAGESIIIFGNEETEAGAYEMTFMASNGCDSTHTINLSVIEEIMTSENLSTCAGEALTIFGNEETEAGAYSMTFTAEGGCDSTHTINLSVLDTFATEDMLSICAGETIDIFGSEESVAGTYSMMFTADNGCDSTHTIVLSVRDTFATSEMASICAGTSIDIFGQTVTEAGEYSMTFTANNGCDSTHTVILDVLNNITTDETISVCDGETTEIFGDQVGTAGEYSMTFTADNGCDSTHTITLEVLDTFATSEELSTCEGTPITIFGEATTEAGSYSMTFQAENGCDSMHTITLVVLPTFSTSASVSICPGETTDVFGQDVDEEGEYSMTFTATNGCDSTHTITVIQLDDSNTSEEINDLCDGDSVEIFGETITESGIYMETFTASNGCDSTHTVTVTFLPTTTTMEEIFICEGESVEIFGEQVSEAGVYEETYTGSNGCDSTHVITLTEEFFEGSAYIFPPCPSTPHLWIVYINTNGNGGPYTVSWNGEDVVNNTINSVPEGDHVATVTSANGCIYTVEFTVRPYQPWWGLVAGPTCNDPQAGEIRVQTEPSSDETYTFSLDGINFSDDPLFEGLVEGEYTLYVKYGDRCVVTETIDVPGPASFSLVLPDDQTINWGESLSIEPTTNVMPGASYEWLPGSSLDCPACEKVIAQPEETTRYFLKVTDPNGCTEVDDILVKVDRRIPYYAPNAFTPNGDGRNDFFTIYAATGVEEIQQLLIFDRWGGEVYLRNNFPPNREQLGWDGRSRNQQVTPGIYVYYAELLLSTGEVVTLKGDVALIR